MKMLSEHFSVQELSQSDTATRLGIDNTPPADVVENLTKLASMLELIRSGLSERADRSVSIHSNSGYRCEQLEQVLCEKDYKAWCVRHGLPTGLSAWRSYFAGKQHPKGQADDFTVPAFGTPLEIVRFIANRPDIMRHIDQIIMEGTWVHVSVSDAPRGIVMTAKFNAQGVRECQRGVA